MRHACAAATFALVLAAGAAASQAPAPRWLRPPGLTWYTFTSTEQAPDKTSSVSLEVSVAVRDGAADAVTIERGQIADGASPPRPIQLGDACTREFRGRDGALGNFDLADGANPVELVPQCVPEGVFGAVTDISTILLIQHRQFGIDGLKAAGDSARFAGFDIPWSRTSPEVRARIVAPGGAIRLASLQPARALVEWRPDPMDLVIVRRVAPAMAVVLRGQERCAFEAAIDPRTGALLGARSIEDRLDLRMWPVQGTELPSLEATPSGPGQPVAIVRTVSLVAAQR